MLASILRLLIGVAIRLYPLSEFAEMIVIRNNVLPVKGGNIQLVCQNLLSKDITGVFKTDNISIIGLTALEKCTTEGCFAGTIQRYSFAPDNTDLVITITNLSILEDQKWWTCNNAVKKEQLFLVVNTLPTLLSLTQNPTSSQDLASNGVVLQCQTNCANPKPDIKWYYKQAEQTKQQWTDTGNIESISQSGQCTLGELQYTSTLTLSKYTTLGDNIDSKVQFQCAISMQVVMKEDLVSQPSSDILFAVKVQSVDLQGDISGKIEVIAGVNAILRCKPGNSRPQATIFWYIGNVKQSGTSSSLTFTPIESDHNKQIYCKAFNFGNEGLAVSSGTSTLFVKIMVTNVSIKDGSSSVTETLNVTENQPKTLTCYTGNSRPNPTVVWYRDGKEVVRSSMTNMHTITPTNADHNGRIYCKAFNIQNEDDSVFSVEAKLFVKVPAVSPRLSNQTLGGLILLSKDTVILECLSSATRPSATVIWKLNNTQQNTVHNTIDDVDDQLYRVRSVLTFTPNITDDGKVVICETYIDNQDSKASVEQRIQVFWPPSKPTITPVDFPWLVNGTGKMLNCFADTFGNPRATVNWNTSMGDEIAAEALDIRILKPQHDAMVVNCTLSNEYTRRKKISLSAGTILDVHYNPVVAVKVDDIDVVNVTRIEGQRLTAICSAIGNPLPVAEWKNYYNQTLTFSDINRTDEGTYNCEAEAISTKFGKLSSRKQLDIIVYYPPTVRLNVSDVLQEHVKMTIGCGALSKPDNYSITNLTQTWNSIFIKSMKVQPNGEFVILNPTIEDSGTYTCYVSNGIPDKIGNIHQSTSAEALIQGKPKVTHKASRFSSGKIGASVNITIPFYSFPVIRKIGFRNPNGTDILNSNRYEVMYRHQNISDVFHNVVVWLDGYLAILYIADQDEHDFGNYTLVLTNGLGQTDWVFNHTSRSKPQAPKNLKLTDIVNGVPIFILTGGFNGGLKQTFIVETSEPDTDKWDVRLNIPEDDAQYIQSDGSYLFNISGLSPKTYIIRVISKNGIGAIEDGQGLTITLTIEGPTQSTKALPVAAIGGGIGAAIVAIGLVITVIMIWRKRVHRKGTDTSALAGNKKGRQETGEDSSDEDVMVENKMYESAGQILTKEDPVYNKPVKKAKVDTKFTDVYAVVDRSKKKDNQKMKKDKPKKKKQFAQGDIYENSPAKSSAGNNTYGNAAFDDNPYENPEGLKPSNTPKRNVNQDGLIYADLAFNDQPKGQKKLVIHGLDEMTTYVQVDFNKKADPLPDSDTEEQSTNKK